MQDMLMSQQQTQPNFGNVANIIINIKNKKEE